MERDEMTLAVADWIEPGPQDNWGPDEWKAYIREATGSAVEAIHETGRRLKLAHADNKAHPERWAGTDWPRWCRQELGYTKGALSALETVGEFGIAKLFSHSLPADYTSLYYLAKWEREHPGSIEAAVKAGKLFAGIQRNQVMELAGSSARAERDKRNAALEAEQSGDDWKIDLCSFRDWKVKAPVNLVLTDPPYAKEHIDLYEDLPTYAADWLAPNGWLAVLVGQGNLPAVASALASGPLTYAWTFCLKSSASRTNAIHPIKIQNTWKPLILLKKGRINLEEWTLDHIDFDWTPKDGDHHKWQQDISPFQKLVRAMSKPGGLVADPFCGSGTTGVAAISTGRRFAGCDEDELSVKAAGDRLTKAALAETDKVVPLRASRASDA
jgi:16S rRNA G966 N2-methylase RsmD